jgi:hypothetical protein
VKTIITTLTMFSVLVLFSQTSTAQENKDNKKNPPQIQIFVQPLQPNPGMGPIVIPIGPGGNAVFPNLPLGGYEFGLFLDPLALMAAFPLPLPPPGGFQLPITLPPLSGLTIGMQAAVLDKKPDLSVGVQTKDGKSDTDNGKGNTKAKVEQVVITVNNMPNNENQPFQLPIGQFRIDADPKEGADKNKVTIGVKFPKPNKHNTR